MDVDFSPLTPSCYRALTDKLYDKRKLAAGEIDKMVRDFVLTNNTASMEKLLRVFINMCDSPNVHIVKGGLMGIGAASVAMGQPFVENFSRPMIDTVLQCFIKTNESRVRYYACESLYNVCKCVRRASLPSFSAIWCAMAQLKTDTDVNVREGADVLDRLLQDLVVEAASFDIHSFMPYLRERIYSDDKIMKQLVITWLTLFHSLPHVNVVVYLSDILDGLFFILADPDDIIIASCENLLQKFLDALRYQKDPDFANMANIIVIHVQSKSMDVQKVAMSWLNEIAQLAGKTLIPHLGGILNAVLPCLSLQEEAWKTTRENSRTINYEMMQLVCKDASSVDLACVVDVLTSHLSQTQFVATQISILKWLHRLQEITPESLCQHLDSVFPVLLTLLSDPADEVVLLSVQVLAEVCSVSPSPSHEIVGSRYFETVMKSLVEVLEKSPSLLDDRGAVIIRQLCVILSPEQIMSTLARNLRNNDNLTFVARLVRQLNNILMTSPELFDTRVELSENASESGRMLFEDLYQVWCFSPIPALCLCLLTKRFWLALRIVKVLSVTEITVEILAELDILVQLIETPIFAFIRLELLEPWRCPDLLDSLYGILMVLPQTEAFHVLRRRLECVPFHRLVRRLGLGAVCGDKATPAGENPTPAGSGTDQQAMLDCFLGASKKYREYRKLSHSANLAAKISSL